MPRKALMSWQGKPNFQWVRMVAGERIRVTARQLGFEGEQRTKANTLDAANDWWEAKQGLLTRKTEAKNQRNENMLDELLEMDRLESEELEKPRTQLEQLEHRLDNDPTFAAKVKQLIAPPKGATVKHWSDYYLNQKLHDKQRSVGRYDNLRRSIRKLVASVGELEPVTAIDWPAWDKFSLAIMGGVLSDTTKRDTISDCREFVRFLQNRDIVPEVKNITETTVRVELGTIQHFSKLELRAILKESACDEWLKLFVLLFCNCGFRQSDVATLTPQMLNVMPGYITRKRHKTKKTNAPTVSWKLWPETIKAIKNHANKSGDLLFTRENGLPWVVEGLNGKNTRKRDDVFRRDLWTGFAKRLELRLSADAIRASSANLLKTDSDRTNQLSLQIKYLGQTPSGIALRHYIDPLQEELDAAVIGLRKVLL